MEKAPDSTHAQVENDFVRIIAGIEVRLPSLSYLKPGLVRRIRRMHDIDALYTLIEMTVSAEALAILDDLDQRTFQALLDEWRVHSGVSLGEF
ncbi:hypothetical protein OG225_07435 [Nocardia sp. NBC_01377]|uniref:hypothetical protein n=1 Tax=Nocardia TaxID=1817 RepID=UPI001C224CBA|nr:hypothetical protein [Nocardia noduli]